ncbi:MAG: hypothetical protein AB1349_10875 [Elusimicrobiota bacterium]
MSKFSILTLIWMAIWLTDSKVYGETESQNIRKHLPQCIETGRKEMNNPYYLSEILFYLGRVGDDPRVSEFCFEIIEKSTNIASIIQAIWTLRAIENRVDKKTKEKTILILKKVLNHKFIEVRLEAADRLFEMDCKEDVYPLYVNIIAQPDIEKKLDEEFRSQFEVELNSALKSLAMIKDRVEKDGIVEFEEGMEIKRQEAEIEKIKLKIGNVEAYKSGAVTKSLKKLISYDDTETRKLVKRIVKEDTYVSSIISRAKKEVGSIKIKWAKERGQKFLDDLFKYMGENK